MALLDMVEDQIDQSLDLMIKNDFCPLKDHTFTIMEFSDHWQKTEANRSQTWGEVTSMTFSIRLWHAPSGMQLSEWSGTPKNEMHKEFWSLTED